MSIWRRTAALATTIKTFRPINNNPGNDPNAINPASASTDESNEITFDGLYAKLPLTPEQSKASNDSIETAMLNLGKAYIQGIEDCAIGTETLETLRTKFPDFAKMDEVLFNLYYCYNKNGETDKAEAIKKLMNEKYSKSKLTTIVTTGKDPADKSGNVEATKAYERIYDLFIEGNFDSAIAQKKIADSLYNDSHWTPQLLYIEAVYFVKQRNDSIAKTVLNDIISKFPQSPLAAKAANLVNVLARRNQIEQELRDLVLKMPDTTRKIPVQGPVVINNNKPQIAKDSVTTQPAVVQPPPITGNNNRPTIDTIAKKPVQPVPLVYTSTPDAPHYVVIVLNKIDPVYVNEARNAFVNYNRDTYYNKQMDAELINVDNDNRLLLISPFKNAQEALDYVEHTRPVTATQILPWLKGGKYFYSIITDQNLELLKNNKDIDKYKQFLDKTFPGKF